MVFADNLPDDTGGILGELGNDMFQKIKGDGRVRRPKTGYSHNGRSERRFGSNN